MKDIKIALAMIVKGTPQEAELLDRCLDSIGRYVDGIYITNTYKKGEDLCTEVSLIAENHGAVVSNFEWCNDFAKARNFNFSQVPKEYDYIMWCDADDIWRGLEKLRPTIKENPRVDAFAFWYLYDFDEYKQPTVVHKKTMIVRNDGCVTWAGKLHEDFKENRSLDVKFVEGIERLHLTTEERVLVAQQRNVEVSLGDLEEHPDDPRVYWNLANSYLGANNFQKAKETFLKFLETSQSYEEKYLAQMRLGGVEDSLGNKEEAIKALQLAIGMRPDYPDSYLQIGYLHFKYGDMDMAEFYLRNGLIKKPPYHTIMVYNPRDYDYNPMMLLSKVYFNKSRPDLALVMLEGCLKIYPQNKYIASLVKELKAESERMTKVIELVKELDEIKDKKEIKKRLLEVPKDLQSHPAICNLRNKYFVKTKSSGKDLVYYCGMTTHEWNPDLFQTKGFGGSEEAVYNLSKEWAKAGWNVTVYNSCGTESMIRDGVTYRPFWEWNPKDKQDITILWRHPKTVDYEINSKRIYVDLHDVIPDGEFTEKRLKIIDKVFVKTKFHRSLFPSIPESKIEVIPNGLDIYKNNQIKKDPYLIINTSSPDRSMDVAPKLFKKIKEKFPKARMQWAYGWENFNNANEGNAKMLAWRDKVNKEMEDAGIENLGRITQKQVGELYQNASIFFFPSHFAEIDCISLKKAQVAKCIPVTSDFGAIGENNIFGDKTHTNKTKDSWCKDYQFSFGVDDEDEQNKLVELVIENLKNPKKIDDVELAEFEKKLSWVFISKNWTNQFQ